VPPDTATLSSLRQAGREGLAALAASYQEDGNPRRLLEARARQVDRILIDLWAASDLANRASMVAVGGYGRGELYPASDVDILILLPDHSPTETLSAVEHLIGTFWDIGLEVGHSVRTIADCVAVADGDITIETTLLEARYLTGNSELFASLQAAMRTTIDAGDFFKAKRLEQNERYLRFQETPYSLEPNCKDSPGGLRDLHVILWIVKAAGLGSRWVDLEKHGLITADEVRSLRQCERFLQDLRIRLHLLVGRREDRLVFDVQTRLAEALGYQASETRRASEVMMQAYYRNAKLVTQLNTILLQNLGTLILGSGNARVTPIDDRFQRVGNLLDLPDEGLFEREPQAILASFLVIQRNPELKGMTARTLRALWRSRRFIDDQFRADPRNKSTFLALLQSPQGIVHEFRRMNQYGILGRYLPAFGKIVGQMQHDLFHVYTVDQHILMVMRNVRRFTMDEFAHEHPLESRLISAFPRHWLLYVAALFHDIAKGRGGDHSQLGMVDAEAFCRGHGLADEDTELVVWLVREHLTMSHIAQKADISDPRVVDEFAQRVGDERHLTALYLLTVADIRGTSHKVWNAWRAQLLAALFRTTRAILRHGKGAPPAQGIVEERQQEAMERLRRFALADSVQEHLWKELDTAYFLRHDADEIAWHTRALHYRTLGRDPVIKARLNRHATEDEEIAFDAGIQVMIYTPDEPALFMRLVGFFARAGFSIVDARIHTTRHGYALDTFVLLDVLDRGNDRELLNYVEYELTEHLKSGKPMLAPSTGRVSRQVKHFPIAPEVTIRADDKGDHYLLTVTAADRPGLLFAIAQVFVEHQVALHSAKITTLGDRISDTFLVGGTALTQSADRIRLETALLERLQV
jgi:[protein-PII] uridylyltransferase